MIALQIADIRVFMKKLLLSETFDRFLLLEGSITTFNTFEIDGTLQKAYYSAEEQDQIEDRSLSLWSEVRPFCFELIDLPPEQIRGLLMNLRYDGHTLTCTTGTSLAVFTLDKKLDHAWDDMVRKYFHQQEIPFQQM